MLGAIIGDMVGSSYEFHPLKSKNFQIMTTNMRMTDDSLLTLAVARVLMNHYPIEYKEESFKSIQEDLKKEFVKTWNAHRNVGWGSLFYQWCLSGYLGEPLEPYNSFGNGSAMRISPVGWIANSVEEVKTLSRVVTEITHNHEEGIKGAEAVAVAIYLARTGSSKEEIREYITKNYYPNINDLDFDELVKTYKFNATCQDSVPQAIYCFLISNSFEDTIRNCIAIGGDADTISAMAGSIAEAFYQKDKPSELEERFLYFLIDPDVELQIKLFHRLIGSKKFQR